MRLEATAQGAVAGNVHAEMTTAPRSFGRSTSILAVLGNRDFRLLWLGGGADNSGRWMEAVVMALLMLDIGGSALQVALLFAFRWTPMLLFALVSGMVADRANRRLVMIVARGVAVVVTAILLVLVASGGARPEHLFVGSLLLGWLYVLEFPSRRSLHLRTGGEQGVGGGNVSGDDLHHYRATAWAISRGHYSRTGRPSPSPSPPSWPCTALPSSS